MKFDKEKFIAEWKDIKLHQKHLIINITILVTILSLANNTEIKRTYHSTYLLDFKYYHTTQVK